jgi:hypothetical protein
VDIKVEKTAVNVIDAAAQGAGDGLHLALNIGGMLIAFLALIAMLNGILGWAHTLPWLGWLPESLEKIFGIVFAPVAWLMGVPWKDAAIGNLLGTRLVTNEFVAFPPTRADEIALDPRPSPSPPTRCAGSPTSAPSPSRSAASARWRPTASRPGAAGPARRGRRNHGQLHVGLHRGNVAVTDEAKRLSRAARRCGPSIGVVLGSGLGAFADELTERTDIPYARFPAGRTPPPWATPAS